MKPKKALVIGGGLCGPATALFLKRAGLEPVVYEARGADRAGGGFFLYLAPNGVNVLRTLGVELPLEPLGFPPTGIVFLNAKGERLGAFDSRLDGARYGAQGLVVKRAELQSVLRREAERQGVPVNFGRELEGLERSAEGGVAVSFRDGASDHGDLLVGCDGLYSRTRQLALPNGPEPSHLALSTAAGLLTCPSCDTFQALRS